MIPARLKLIPKPAPNQRNTAQRAENAHLRTSPVFQRLVIDSAQKFFVFGAPEISALVLAELRSRWPEATAADVDYALVASALAYRSEAACYRESMLSGLRMGERAGQEAHREARLRRAA